LTSAVSHFSSFSAVRIFWWLQFLKLCGYAAVQQNFHRGRGHILFNISGQNVNFVQGGPKNWHTFLYALSFYALTSSNIGRFSN